MSTFTKYEPDRHAMPLAAADSMRSVWAMSERRPKDLQWRGWCATGHKSASWWPLVIIEHTKEYVTSSFAARLLERSENDVAPADVGAIELRTPWIDMKPFQS